MSLVSPINTSITNQQQLLSCARGEIPCELVLKNGQVVNTFTGEILDQDVGIFQGRIAGVGQYRGHSEVDFKRRYICPGFIEGHLHIENSMLSPDRFTRAFLMISVPLPSTRYIGKAGLLQNMDKPSINVSARQRRLKMLPPPTQYI